MWPDLLTCGVIAHLGGGADLVFDMRKTTFTKNTYEFYVECASCKTIYSVFCASGKSARHTLPGCDKIEDIRLISGV